MMKTDNRTYNALRISCAFGAGSNKASGFCEAIQNGGFIDSDFEDLLKSGFFDGDSLARLNSVKPATVDGILRTCEDYKIRVITVFNGDYPNRLKNIPSPPVVLYVLGNLPDIDSDPLFCIVGPRRISEFGRKAAFSLSRRLSKAGMTVVSGTAAGADTAAHLGALDANAGSVMVAADGIVSQLKSSNHELVKRILERGAVISENPPEKPAGKYSFPIRNRLMSGISIGVAVVEAPKISGALITAGHAAEQGRDVFVVPGSPADKCYEGSNALLRDGATPLLDASDIFSRYVFDFPEKIDVQKAFGEGDKKQKKALRKKSTEGLSNEALLVYNNLVKQEFTVDDLSALSLDGAVLLSALTELEMERFISSLPGGLYRKID